MKRNPYLIITGLIISLGAAWFLWHSASHDIVVVERPSTGTAQIGGHFHLIDQNKKGVTDKDFRGHFMLVYFGFTFCPDICPLGMSSMSAALKQLGPHAGKVMPIFITVDPERDTPEQLKLFGQNFNPAFTYLTGTLAQVEVAKKAYRVYAQKVKPDDTMAEYLVDHSSIIYLMGPDGKMVTHFTHTTPPEEMAAKIKPYL